MKKKTNDRVTSVEVTTRATIVGNGEEVMAFKQVVSPETAAIGIPSPGVGNLRIGTLGRLLARRIVVRCVVIAGTEFTFRLRPL